MKDRYTFKHQTVFYEYEKFASLVIDKHTPNAHFRKNRHQKIGKTVAKIENAQKWVKIKRKNLGRVFHQEKEENAKNKQTNVRETKLKTGVVLALNKRTKKAHTFPTGGIAIPLQGIKRKLDDRRKIASIRQAGQRRTTHSISFRFLEVFLPEWACACRGAA